MEYSECLAKQEQIKKKFSNFNSADEKYQHIIERGRNLPTMSEEDRIEKNRVRGCQSLLFLRVECIEGALRIAVHSDALISAGLAALLIEVYQGESPEAVIKCPPLFLREIGLLESLTPSRANGLKSLYQKLQEESLKFLK